MHSGASYFDILLCLYFIFIKHFNSLLMKKKNTLTTINFFNLEMFLANIQLAFIDLAT
jgi:hypothetical protein